MNIVVFDTETTGVDHEKDRVVEVSGWLVDTTAKKKAPRKMIDSLVNPGVPIPSTARAIHHISDKMVKGRDTLDELMGEFIATNDFIPAAHNSGFDAQFLPMIKADWICTYRCARQLWPDSPGFSNQCLRYELGLDLPEKMTQPTHRASPDAFVTAHILIEMLKKKTADELVALTKAPILIKTVGFGKHRGEEWGRVPRDYLSWVVRQDFDRDVLHTARHWLSA